MSQLTYSSAAPAVIASKINEISAHLHNALQCFVVKDTQ